MRILIICDILEKKTIRNILSKNNIAVVSNILFEHSLEKGQEFIDKRLVLHGGHIDLLMITGSIRYDVNQIHLVDRLRYTSSPYSRSCFKLSGLPTILYAKEIRQTDYYEFGYNARVVMNDLNNQKALEDTIRSIGKTFRQKILDDLELLHIPLENLQSGTLHNFDPHYYSKIKAQAVYWASRTAILSKQFIAAPKRLEYDWVTKEKLHMEQHVERYEKILITVKKFSRKDSEKSIFHRLYHDAPWLLQTDIYERPIYEPSLIKEENGFEEPDCILPSSMPGVIPNNVTEVKLPTLELLHRRTRKPGLKSSAHDAFGQLADYRRHIKKQIGKQQFMELVHNNSQVIYTLLACTEWEVERNIKRLNELLQDQYKGLRLMTHTEKLSEAIRYYERMIWLK